MFQDDKIGIGWGRLAPMDEFGRFDGLKWTLDEAKAKIEFDAVSKAGANLVRVMPYGVWGKHPGGKKTYQFQPYVLDAVKDKWDLAIFNDYYFPIMKKIFALANDVGLTVLFDLFDNCQFHGAYAKYSPWFSNVQGLTSFYGKGADVYSKRWVSTMTLRYAAFDMIWGFGNEMENAAFPDFAKRVIFPYINLRKIPFSRLTYGATMKNTGAVDSIQDTVRKAVRNEFGLVAEKDIIQEDHGFSFTWGLSTWGSKPYRKLFSDDGCYTGKSLCDIRPGKGARPSAAEWGNLSLDILKKYPTSLGGRARLISFEHLPAGYSTGSLECKVAPIRAISAAYRARFGTWPKNYKS